MESYFGRTLTTEPRRFGEGDEHTIALAHPNSMQEMTVLSLGQQAFAAQQLVSTSIPTTFAASQAIDSATFVGQGASFAVYRRRIPPLQRQKVTMDMGGWTVSMDDPRKIPDHVAYKYPPIELTDLGESSESSRHTMRSAIMELFLTSHKPVLEHPNIVNFLGLTWGSNPFNSQHKTPILVVEYAQLGSLYSLQKRQFLDYPQRRKICRDVCQGLDVLHQCGIVHGDVKAENILVFPDQEHGYTAKLSDFGHSLVCEAESEMTSIGGTLPWIAPEGKAPIPKSMLKSTDIYSLGLLIWSVFAQGYSPFKLVLGGELDRERYVTEAEQLKETDAIRTFGAFDQWYPKMLQQSAQSKASRKVNLADQGSTIQAMQTMLTTVAQAQTLGAKEMQEKLEETVNTMEMLLPSFAAHGFLPQMMRILPAIAGQTNFYRLLKPILDLSVIKSAQARDLQKILSLLRGETIDPESIKSATHMLKSYPTYLTNVMLDRATDGLSRSTIHPLSMLNLTALQLNGWGTAKNTEKALQWYRWLFKADSQVGTAYGFRLLSGLKVELGDDPSAIVKSLVTASLKGSYAALADLAKLSSEEYAKIRKYLKRSLAGIGANHFFQQEMLHNFNHGSWMMTMENVPVLLENFSRLNHIDEYKANRRGDRILHVAAASGQLEALKALLDRFPKLVVNQINDQGETPLLSAARAGHLDIVIWLCENGADATIYPPTKESPLHWLVSFEDDEIERAGLAMIAAGGKLDVLTTSIVGHSVFQQETGLERLPPGSPLLWACRLNRPAIVDFLVSNAADVHTLCYQKQDGNLTPLDMASRQHHSSCLETMIDRIHAKNLAKSNNKHGGMIYGPLMEQVLLGGNLFAMLLSNGDAYQQEMEATLSYLIRLGAKGAPAFGNRGFKSTLLYQAVSLACDEIVEFLLEKGESVMESSDEYDEETVRTTSVGPYKREHIDQACGVEMRTPLLEAIRWNRKVMVDMLVKHGADVHATACNPFTGEPGTWTALHVFAHAAHNRDVTLVEQLIDAGAVIDSPPEHAQRTESPLLISLQNDCMNLAASLLERGAKANSLSIACGHLAVADPTTPLGHVVATNARHSLPRLRYLMSGERRAQIDFVVTPSLNRTALHRAALGHLKTSLRATDVTPSEPLQWDDIDWAANGEIFNELLQHYHQPEHLNAQDSIGRTALHWAVEAGNSEAITMLLRWGTDPLVKDSDGETAADLATRLQLSTANITEERRNQSVGEIEARRACCDLLLPRDPVS